MTTIASDAFGRTVAAISWGTADLGGIYTNAGITGAASMSVNGSEAVISLDAASRRVGGCLLSVSQLNTDILVRYRLNKVPTGGQARLEIGARTISAPNGGYYGQLFINTTGLIDGNFYRRDAAGAQVAIGSSSASGLAAYTASRWLWFRFQAIGTSPTTIRSRAWYDGDPEPGTWMWTQTDSTALQQAAGGVNILAALGTGVTTLPWVANYDDLVVTDAAALPTRSFAAVI